MADWESPESRIESLQWKLTSLFHPVWWAAYRRLRRRRWRAAVLASVRHPDGEAAVMRDRGELWLTGDLKNGPGTMLHGFEPGMEGLLDDRIVEGGGLPLGAVGCEVIDAAGNRHQAEVGDGAWVIVLEGQERFPFDTHPVRYFDAEGRTVPRVYPEASREPVEDASEPCPACGAREWDEVVVLDGSRGEFSRPDGSLGPMPVVVCHDCGHSDNATTGGGWSRSVQLEDGTWFSSAGAGSEDEAPTDDALRRQAQAFMAEPDLSGLTFPVYMARNYPAQVAGWGGGETITGLTVTDGVADGEGAAPQIQVHTQCWYEDFHGDESDEARAREALWILIANVEIWNGEWPPDRSEAGMATWQSEQERRQRKLAAEAEAGHGSLEIDGRPEECVIARSGELWAAVRHHGSVLITVSSSKPSVEEAALQEVPDPVSELQGGR